MITVVLVDHDSLVREGIRSVLNKTPDIQIIEEAENEIDIERIVDQFRPQILLVDIAILNSRLAKLVTHLSCNFPKTALVVLSAFDHDAYLSQAMDAGAVGFIIKSISSERLIKNVRRVANGDAIFTKEQYARTYLWHNLVGKKWESLSKREMEILQFIVQGAEINMIAGTMGLSFKTINYHLSNIYKKLNVKSRHEAMVWVQNNMPHEIV